MEFRTKVEIAPSKWRISPGEEILFVGSCFADYIGRRFQEELFRTTINPFGVMYNPISILHTIERWGGQPNYVVLSLGTNHIYIDKATSLVVDNCQKRPAHEFQERGLTIEECLDTLIKIVDLCKSKVIVTVSPIRYKKYGFHGSQLSKATLLLATHRLEEMRGEQVEYFPSYEIVMDELRDYRFYSTDMLHPSHQTVEYIFGRFVDTYFSDSAKEFLREWKPLKEALNHRPLHPESKEYKDFMAKTTERISELKKKYEL